MPQAPTPKKPLKVFLCHASVDKATVRLLYTRLTEDGVDAWLDKEKLMPGQDWEWQIRKAVRESDIVVVCLSKQFNQDGFRQKEVKLALDVAMEKPEGEIFIIPARLEDCDTPYNLGKWHRVDLFEENGYESLMKTFRARADEIKATLRIKREQINAKHVRASSPDGRAKAGGNVSDSVIVTGDKNVINMSTKKQASDSSGKKSNQKKNRTKNQFVTAIIVALIGIFGTICAALIVTYGRDIWFALSPVASTPTTSITETEVPTSIPTLIPTNTTLPDTPNPTLIAVTPTIVPVPIGEDWLAGCISSLWKAYPSNAQTTDKGDGCLQEPVHAFSAEFGDLDFLYEREKGTPEIYGLFALMPESGTVTFTIRLRELSNADLLMGIFGQPDVNSQGLLMTILNGNVARRAFVQKNPITYETLQGSQAISQGNGYSISFTFDNLSGKSIVNPSVFFTDSVSIPSTQKWLFLGYKGLRGYYRIEGTFLNFELKP